MGIIFKALENTIPPEMDTGAQKIMEGASSAAFAAAASAAISPEILHGLKGITTATEMATNAALTNGSVEKSEIGGRR